VGQITNGSDNEFRDPGTISQGYVFRDQKGRYPWWVKSVDNITTETDDNRFKKHDTTLFKQIDALQSQMPDLKKDGDEKLRAFIAKSIKENIPGRTLPDLALHYAAGTYFHYRVGNLGDDSFISLMPGISEINTWKLHPPQSFGLPPWKASPEEASHILETAGTQLGAAMVGFTTINPNWLDNDCEISPDVDNISSVDGKTLIPERMKYVICILGVTPQNLVDRNFSFLGAAGDRAGYEQTSMAYTRVMRFVRGLGYDAYDLQLTAIATPFAIAAGLGELGRMNRMVNPIFGGNVRIGMVLTDLPLAIDKPIDFGLQKFCEKCKKCATSCPGNAISKEDKPTWEPSNKMQTPGKKVYFEDIDKCMAAQNGRDYYCSTCMAVCPWSKQDKTVLHELAHIMASKFPGFGKLLVKMDDLFGYGRITRDDKLEEWWEQRRPIGGVDSYQGRK